ncbi:MAG: response regulator, partial [bacterium]
MSATIVLVEDNPITSKLVRHTLEAEYHDVQVAFDCASGVELVRSRRPALILLDLMLPDGDGFELFHRLRALPGATDVPILALSGMLSPEDGARLAKVG